MTSELPSLVELHGDGAGEREEDERQQGERPEEEQQQSARCRKRGGEHGPEAIAEAGGCGEGGASADEECECEHREHRDEGGGALRADRGEQGRG